MRRVTADRGSMQMNVMDVAHAAGITSGEATGTIDEAHVLTVLSEMSRADEANVDLYTDAAKRVRRARSAGLEHFEMSVFTGASEVAPTQLRYRSEMAEIFIDLAIDVGLRKLDEVTPAA